MLGLKLPTDPRWVNIVEQNIESILSDHAWCEQKAASNAISIITNNSEHPDLVTDMLNIAKEEVEHFDRVHELIKKRGLVLHRERKDEYVNDLMKFQIKGGSRVAAFVDRMLFSALIEARSCERFKILSQNIKDEELAAFYRDLMESEANHYTVFIGYARKYGIGVDVEKRWKEWLAYENEIIGNYGKRETMHG
ncbi:MAG: tRNA-(ms[2]io[6]A)-hydroxylase [Bacteroidetes bacterium]|jgi:tRNA-(ms[2]io[6]A)-hydroxylase|nr:tRNA-(ms[2]io[6]A)-hydroxylase [Bacteroidota bacterium]